MAGLARAGSREHFTRDGLAHFISLWLELIVVGLGFCGSAPGSASKIGMGSSRAAPRKCFTGLARFVSSRLDLLVD
jgi:hypothetical protein